MIRHILYLVGLSVAAIFFKNQLVHVVHFLMYLHARIANGLGVIFSVDMVGEMVQSVLSLLLIPVVVGIVIGLAHFMLKQVHFPHTMTVIWISWAVLLVAVLSGSHQGSAPVAFNDMSTNSDMSAQGNMTAQGDMNAKSLAQNGAMPAPGVSTEKLTK